LAKSLGESFDMNPWFGNSKDGHIKTQSWQKR